MDLFDNLSRWNPWGSWQIKSGHNRLITSKILQYVPAEEVIALIGPRRAGKSTILYQLIENLLQQEVDPKAILHINLEEPALSPFLKAGVLDQLYNAYRSRVFPRGKAYIFLDEIQNVPEWERWVRARNDLEDIKIFLTGSSSSLLSGELATVLSGRNFCFNIYPLSFVEALNFKGIDIPKAPLPLLPPPEINFALHEYMQWGGFPRVVLAKTEQEKELLLRRYFDEILFRDIVQRYQIRNIMALRNIAVHMLTNTSTLVSVKRLANIFEVSQDLAQTYITYLQEAFIIHLLPFYSLKASERVRNPYKTHALDLGLRRVASLSVSVDMSKLIETTVFNYLHRDAREQLFYWKGEGEIDVLTQDGVQINKLFQVAYTSLDQPDVLAREIGGLQKAMEKFPKAKAYLISMNGDAELADKHSNITVIPLWHFLLGKV